MKEVHKCEGMPEGFAQIVDTGTHFSYCSLSATLIGISYCPYCGIALKLVE